MCSVPYAQVKCFIPCVLLELVPLGFLASPQCDSVLSGGPSGYQLRLMCSPCSILLFSLSAILQSATTTQAQWPDDSPLLSVPGVTADAASALGRLGLATLPALAQALGGRQQQDTRRQLSQLLDSHVSIDVLQADRDGVRHKLACPQSPDRSEGPVTVTLGRQRQFNHRCDKQLSVNLCHPAPSGAPWTLCRR